MFVLAVSNRFFLIRIWSASIFPILEAEPPVKHSGENPRNEELLRDAIALCLFGPKLKSTALEGQSPLQNLFVKLFKSLAPGRAARGNKKNFKQAAEQAL